MDSSASDNSKSMSDRISVLNSYFGVEVGNQLDTDGNTDKNRDLLSDVLNRDMSSRLQLNIIRAFEPEQLRKEAYAECAVLVRNGVNVVPLETLAADLLVENRKKPEVYVIWEGKFGNELANSGLLMDLIAGRYSGILRGTVIILALMGETLSSVMNSEKRMDYDNLRVEQAVEAEVRSGFFLLGASMVLSLVSLFFYSGLSTSYTTAFTVTEDASIAATVAGFILLVIGLRGKSNASRLPLYILIAAFILTFVVRLLVYASIPSFSFLRIYLAYETAVFVETSILIFLMLFSIPGFTRRILAIISLSVSLIYVIYSDIMAISYSPVPITVPVDLQRVNPTYGASPVYFSFSLPFLQYSYASAGLFTDIFLYVAASLLYSAAFIWISVMPSRAGSTKQSTD